jgi:hypothetical protein
MTRVIPGYRVDPVTGCRVWQGKLTQAGYGYIRIDGRMEYTHRLCYEVRVGPIPKGLVLDHVCENRACCNPEHLNAVTQAENLRRMAERRVACKRGHPWLPGNTYVAPDGERQCRTCNRERERDRARRRVERERAERAADKLRARPPSQPLRLDGPPIPLGLCQCGCGAETDTATRTSSRRGAVKGQPLRYRHGHSGNPYELGAYSIDARTGCWVWQWSTVNGYGQIFYRGKLHRAHRLFYELLVGEIPAGAQIDHLCKNRACVNVSHLDPVTPLENVRRSRQAKP